MPSQKRPRVLPSRTRKKTTGCGNLYVTVVTLDDSTPWETFIYAGRAGGCNRALNEAIARLLARALQRGDSLRALAKCLSGISCPSGTNSCPNEIAAALTDEANTLEEQA
jgi:hypothetical protein